MVFKPFTSLLNLHRDMAAAFNHSRDIFAEQIWSEHQADLVTMDWRVC